VVLAPDLHRRREPERVVRGEPGPERHDLPQRGPAAGRRPGLVEEHVRDPGGRLEDVAPLHEQAPPAGEARRDEDRDGRREAQGAGAGDDHHRDPGHHRLIERRAARPPGDERAGGEDEHDRDEDPHHPVRHRLDAGLGRLGLLDGPDDPGEHGLLSHARHRHHERAVEVHGPADHGGTRPLPHRPGLARHQGLVHLRRALEHDAVERDPLPGDDLDAVPADDLAHRDRAPDDGAALARLEAPGLPRRQRRQARDRLRRPPLRRRLHVAPDEGEGGDGRGGVEVDLPAAEHLPDRVDEGGARADRHEGVHPGRPAPQARPGAAEEGRPRVQVDRERQREGDPLHEPPRAGLDPLEVPGVERRLVDHELRGEEERRPEPDQQIAGLGAPRGGANALRPGLRLVAGGADAREDRGEVGARRVPADPGAVGRVVHARGEDARGAEQHALVQPDAGGTADPVDVDLHLVGPGEAPDRPAERGEVEGSRLANRRARPLPAPRVVVGAEPLPGHEPVDAVTAGARLFVKGLAVCRKKGGRSKKGDTEYYQGGCFLFHSCFKFL
jgi:hypothetical protein